MSYNEDDMKNAVKFASYNETIRILNVLKKKSPHLTTHLKITKRPATNDDFYIPEKLKNLSFVISVETTKDFCDMLTCNPIKERDVCKQTDKPHYYRVGDDAFDIQCHWSCFHTIDKPTYNEDSSRAPDTLMLNFHNNKCRIVNSNMISYLEKPSYRSDSERDQKMPTGFSRYTDTKNKYGCGFRYRNNKAYCESYDQILKSDGSCSQTIGEFVLDAVIGMSLINTIKSAIRSVSTGTSFNLPKDLPEYPKELPIHQRTLENWLNNINKDFTIPNVQEYNIDDNDDDNDDEMNKRKKRSITSPHGDEKMTQNDEEDEENDDWQSKTKQILIALLEALTTSEFWLQVGIGVMAETALNRVKKLCYKIIEKLTTKLAKQLPLTIGRIGVNVLKSGLRSVAKQILVKSAIRVASKAAISLAKFTAAAASVVGWLLLAATVFDIIFAIWDPYGYNSMWPESLPNDLLESGDRALREMMQSTEANFEFENFINMMLSEDELMEIRLHSLVDQLTYLNTLEVNSDGQVIDKGVDINFDGINVADKLTNISNKVIVKRHAFNLQTYNEFNERFLLRLKIIKILNIIATGFLILSTVTLVMSLLILFMVLLIISILIYVYAYFQYVDDTLVDFIRTHITHTTL